MATDEDYLDSLLRSVMENEPDPDKLPPIEKLPSVAGESESFDDAILPDVPVIDEDIVLPDEPVFPEDVIFPEESGDLNMPEINEEEELPIFEEELPGFDEELPIIEDEISGFDDELPVFEEELPIFKDEELPVIDEELVGLDEDLPLIEEEMPAFEEELPGFEEELPTLEEEMPGFEEEMPAFEDELPGFEEELPALDEEMPGFDGELPVFEEELPVVEDELSGFEEELPAFDEGLAGFEDELPGFEEELPAFDEELPILDEEMPNLEEELPILEEESPLSAEKPLILYDEVADFDIPAFEDEVDLSLGGIPEDDVPSESVDGEEVMLSDFDLDSMFAGIDENIEMPDESADFSASQMDNMDIGDLLSGMGDDEDLSDIKNMLDKDDNNELVDDDMLSLLDGVEGYAGDGGDDMGDVMSLLDEPAPAKSPKPKKKLWGKKKAAGDDGDEEFALSPEELDAQLSSNKKKGFFGKIFATLTESDDESEEIEVNIQAIAGEGLGELEGIPEKDSKKKAKKEKKPKEKKEKKPKEKKPKKEKPVKEPEEPEKPVKKVSKKNVLLVFIFSTSLLSAIIAFCLLIPDYMEFEQAKQAYQNEDHRGVFNLLYAKNRGFSDDFIFNQAQIVLRMNRPLDSYSVYLSLDKPVEALNALLNGINRYDEIMEESLYGADVNVNQAYQEILSILSGKYGLSEMDARNILKLESVQYTRRLYELTMGIDFSDLPLVEYGD